MAHDLPEPFRALTDPDTLWEVLQALPLRVTLIETDEAGGLRLAASDLTGGRHPLAPVTAAGLDIRAAFVPEQVQYLEETLATGRCIRYTTPLDLPDGTRRVVDGTNVPLPDGRVLVFTYNLTARAEELERAHEYAAAILRASPDRFWVTGRDLVIRHYEGPDDWRTPPGTVGRHMAEVYPPELVERFRTHIDETLASGEMRTVVADGVLEPERVFETRIVPFGADEVLLASRDVTDFHRAQRAADQRATIDAISARVLRELFDLVGEPFVRAAQEVLGAVGEAIGADTATLGRRLRGDSFERLVVWSRPGLADALAQFPRVVDMAQMPDAFSLMDDGENIVVTSAAPESLGPLAREILDRGRSRSALIVPFQSADDLTAYVSFYWVDDDMPDVEPVMASIRSAGMNLFAALQRSEAEVARAEASERLEQALVALRFNEERFRLVSRATNDVLWDWDLTTDELWWGDGITSVFGHDRAELDPTIKSWEQLLHPDDVDRVLGSIYAAINGGGRSWASEYRFVHRRGGYQWVLDRGEILHDATGRPVRMVGGIRDISERRRTESLLREQARLLDAATDVIYERDLDGRITYWNRAAERTYGWRVDEVVGRSVLELFHADADAFAAATDAVLADGEWAGEFAQRRVDGSELVVEARWTLVRDELGEPRSVLAINTDVTERRRWEQQLLRSQRMESIGTLAGGIAHDLNNVLTPILMTTELLRLDETDPDRQASLATIEIAAQRGADLVRQVLSFARGVEARDEDVDIAALFADLATILREAFPRNIVVRIVESSEPLHVAGDPTQLAQVLMNLCVNARDAMPDGGELVIAAERRSIGEGARRLGLVEDDGEFVVVTVTDTGAGIPPEIAERVFEPFFTTKEHGSGTGLGLPTAMAIVRSHHGILEFSSEVGRGTTFSMSIPAGLRECPGQAEDEAPDLPRGHGEHVLVIDDEEVVLATVRQVLRLYGYRVATVTSGDEAVRAMADADPPFDAVVTDLMMPGIDGIASARAIRALRPGIPIVAASGVRTDDAVERARAVGIHHVLAKPYSITTLLSALREALRGDG